jgi:predicted SAM-dependent methyltransferase
MMEQERKLNLGCGPLLLDGWINMDAKAWTPTVFVRDLTKGLPFDTESVDEIYCSHFLEHLSPGEEVGYFLHECARVLKKGSKMIICVPDGNGRDAFMPDHKSFWSRAAFQVLPRPTQTGLPVKINSIKYREKRAELVAEIEKI